MKPRKSTYIDKQVKAFVIKKGKNYLITPRETTQFKKFDIYTYFRNAPG